MGIISHMASKQIPGIFGDHIWVESGDTGYLVPQSCQVQLSLQCPTDAHCHAEKQKPFMDPTHPGLAASYGPWTNRPGLLVPTEDLGDTTVRNSKLSRDYAGSDAVVGHLYYLVSDVIW